MSLLIHLQNFWQKHVGYDDCHVTRYRLINFLSCMGGGGSSPPIYGGRWDSWADRRGGRLIRWGNRRLVCVAVARGVPTSGPVSWSPWSPVGSASWCVALYRRRSGPGPTILPHVSEEARDWSGAGGASPQGCGRAECGALSPGVSVSSAIFLYLHRSLLVGVIRCRFARNVYRGRSPARAILWRRSFVCRLSCIAMYHKYRTVSGIQTACKLLQMRCQSSVGFRVFTRHRLIGVTADAIVCSAQ